jgi:hypothetical protein
MISAECETKQNATFFHSSYFSSLMILVFSPLHNSQTTLNEISSFNMKNSDIEAHFKCSWVNAVA